MLGMANTPDRFYDLAVVGPPYGIGEDGSKNHTRVGGMAMAKIYKPFAGNDKQPPNNKYFIELKRVSKNQIIFGANHFANRFSINSSCWIVWDKDNGANDFADCELAWTNLKMAVRMKHHQWNGMLRKGKEKRWHPTQKPLEVISWAMQLSPKSEMILDCFMGSGTTLLAAKNLGKKSIGIEIEEKYCEIAALRLQQEVLPL
jgi:site-specific DNA-methyltransferase (adenine-specific)